MQMYERSWSEAIFQENCVNQPALEIPGRRIELDDLKSLLLHPNGESKQVISFTNEVQLNTDRLANGMVQITQNGTFLAPWMRHYVPAYLFRVDYLSIFFKVLHKK
ncbi:MAG: hypothetical protein HAW62_04925 [Endozoicomonadaceae bacterium]|nr:hypothetical protein [Endozoicomonadaceae bacterium]